MSPSPFPSERNIFGSSNAQKRKNILRWCGWFFLFCALVWMLISLRFLGAVELPEEPSARIFTIAAFIGHYSSIALLCSLLLVPFIAVFPNRAFVTALAIVMASTVTLILLLDTFIFEQYRYHINGMVLNLVFGGAAGDIFEFSAGNWLLTGLAFVLILALQIVLAYMAWRWSARIANRRFGLSIAGILFSVFLAQNLVYAWADAKAYSPITQQIRYLPAYRPATAKRFFTEQGWAEPPTTPQLTHVAQSNLHYPLKPLVCQPQETPPNIFTIVIDSWRADSMTEEVTPNIFELSKYSLNFSHHYSGANSTRMGMFSLFYALPGTYWQNMLSENKGPVYINELQKQGYEMGIFASAKLTSPEFHRTIFAEVENLRTQSQGNNAYERDRNITDEFIRFLQNQQDNNQPIYGFLFYDAPHAYAFPPDYEAPFAPSWEQVNYLALENGMDPTPFINRYKNATHYADSLVGEVLRAIAENGLLENSIIVITGDHGQEFNDNGLNFWGHNSNFSDPQTRVPLLVFWPGRETHEYAHTTSHFDIVPTIMQDALNCLSPFQDYSSGKHLLDPLASPYLILSSYNSFAVKQGPLVTVVDEFGQIDVYDENYRSSKDRQPPQETIMQVMREMGRFYR